MNTTQYGTPLTRKVEDPEKIDQLEIACSRKKSEQEMRRTKKMAKWQDVINDSQLRGYVTL